MTSTGIVVQTNGETQKRKRTQRLRPSRVVIEGALAGQVRAHATHAELGNFTMKVLDLSIHGARVEVDAQLAPQARTVLLGDRLELSISIREDTIYRGQGTITRVIDDGKSLAFGVELSDVGVDLATIHRESTRSTAEERWKQVKVAAAFEQLDDAFLAWIAHVADTLGTIQSFLDREESELAGQDLATRQALSDELLRAVTPDLVKHVNDAGAELTELIAKLPKELHADYRAAVLRQLGRFFAAAPFMHRAYTKPLGYAGDYEMMNMLYRDHREGASLFGKAMNVWATQLPCAQANINRITYLGNKIVEVMRSKPSGRVRVASIGCGPAKEIHAFLTNHPELGERLDVALIDQEQRAIVHCERTLAQLAARTNARVRPIRESARHLLTDRKLGEALGECDFVYSAGLFDYLPERSFTALLHVLYHSLAPGGTLAIGNVAEHNPDRATMEFFAEWFLHHRTPLELQAMADTLAPAPSKIQVEAEPTGVNLFLIVQR